MTILWFQPRSPQTKPTSMSIVWAVAVGTEISLRPPGSRTKGFCACQDLRRRGAGSCLAMTTLAFSPSVGRKTSAPRHAAQYLAYALPYQRFACSLATTRAGLRAGVARYAFTVTDLHRLPFASLPAHPSTASEADMPRSYRDVCYSPNANNNQCFSVCGASHGRAARVLRLL